LQNQPPVLVVDKVQLLWRDVSNAVQWKSPA
jgi:hypothetical protein